MGSDGCSDGNDYLIECTDAGGGMADCTCYVNDENIQECQTEGSADTCEGIDMAECCTKFPDFGGDDGDGDSGSD